MIYLSGIKIQYKPKFKLHLDIVSKHVLLYLQLFNYTFKSNPCVIIAKLKNITVTYKV